MKISASNDTNKGPFFFAALYIQALMFICPCTIAPTSLGVYVSLLDMYGTQGGRNVWCVEREWLTTNGTSVHDWQSSAGRNIRPDSEKSTKLLIFYRDIGFL